MYQLAPYIMITSIFYMLTSIVMNLIQYRLKKKMVDASIFDPDTIKLLLKIPEKNSESNNIIKWAVILFFAGFGLIVDGFLPFSWDNSTVPAGIEIVFISCGFFVYYLIKKRSPDLDR